MGPTGSNAILQLIGCCRDRVRTQVDRSEIESNAYQIGQRVDHDFDEPLGLLSDCHRRIEHFLRALVTVATDVSVAGA